MKTVNVGRLKNIIYLFEKQYMHPEANCLENSLGTLEKKIKRISRPRGSWLTDQNNILHVSMNNSRTAWPQIFVPFLTFQTMCLRLFLSFQKSSCNYEIQFVLRCTSSLTSYSVFVKMKFKPLRFAIVCQGKAVHYVSTPLTKQNKTKQNKANTNKNKHKITNKTKTNKKTHCY